MTTEAEKCENRIDAHLESTLDDIKRLWEAECDGKEYVEDLGTLNDYGLSFDYVAPGTFNEQPEGYFRWQLSWGGPSDEFRFYVNPDFSVHRIVYHFMDWFDGAKRELAIAGTVLHQPGYDLIHEIWQSWFSACDLAGMVEGG